MRVAVDGVYSPWAVGMSGVPQGTVLRPLLFLICMNELLDCVMEGTILRLFADDCLEYQVIHSHDDQVILDKDLTSLHKWSERCGMSFNPSKCDILQVSRGNPSSQFYQLCGEVLQKVSDAKYLGILISSDLSWDKHISNVAKRANYTLGLIRRNLHHCARDAKTTVYFSLVRFTTKYCSATSGPYLEKDKTKLERVNCHVARVICNKTDPRDHTSVTNCWGTTLSGPHWNTGDATWDSPLCTRYVTSRLPFHLTNFSHPTALHAPTTSINTKSFGPILKYIETFFIHEQSLIGIASQPKPLTVRRATVSDSVSQSSPHSVQRSLHRRDIPLWKFLSIIHQIQIPRNNVHCFLDFVMLRLYYQLIVDLPYGKCAFSLAYFNGALQKSCRIIIINLGFFTEVYTDMYDIETLIWFTFLSINDYKIKRFALFCIKF